MNVQTLVMAFTEFSWVTFVGIVMMIWAILSIPETGWNNKKHKFWTISFIVIGLFVIDGSSYFAAYRGGVNDGTKNGLNFATYHVAKIFTQPVPMDKLKEDVLYRVWNNMPDRNMSFVLGEDESAMLIIGLKGIPEEAEFVKRKGEIFIQTKKKSAENK